MEHMTPRQMTNSLEQMIDFTKSQLSRNLTLTETTYYKSRLFALTECLQMARQLSQEG